MAVQLVLPGNYAQFHRWLRQTYGVTQFPQSHPIPRPILKEEELFGIEVSDVESFEQVGTYWENAVWGSESYLLFMEEAEIEGRPWAMGWTEDWHRAEALRNPATPEEMTAARAALERIVNELSGS